MRFPNQWSVGEWTFYQVEGHGFSGDLKGKPLYGFTRNGPEDTSAPGGTPKLAELFGTLEHAMVAAVGEKYTGRRTAGGSGVGTAADWFMKMIGAEILP